MRVDAPLVTLLLSASASAQYAYNTTNSTGDAKQMIAELEKEIQSLHQQIDDASKTCDNPSGELSGAASSGASPAGYAPAASGVAPSASVVAPAGYTPAPSSSASVEDVTSVSTIVEGTSTRYSTIVLTKTVSPVATSLAAPGYAPPGYSSADAVTYVCNPAHVYPNGASCISTAGTLALVTPTGAATPAESTPAAYSMGGASSEASPAESGPAGYAPAASSESSPAASGPAGYAPVAPAPAASGPFGSAPAQSEAAAAAATTPGNYYAPNAPASTQTKTSTITVIVTPGQAAPTSQAGDDDVYTCTETYAGSASIPSPPSSLSASDASAGSSAAVPYPYPVANGTMPAGSSGLASTGAFASTGVFAPTGIVAGTGMSSSAVLVPTGFSTSASLSSVAPIFGTVSSGVPINSANATSTSTSSTPTASPTDCAAVCSEMTTYEGWDVTPLTCTQLTAGTEYDTPSGQSSVGCGTSFTPSVDLCQVTLNVKTSGSSNAYMEVWLPNGNSSNGTWNGRSMSTDNGGLNGCVHYVDMQYVSGLGFASIGDNAGHNGSSFDGTWTLNDNEAIIDWSYRARHASITVGKQLISEFYSKKPEYSYYIGCSTGGAQGIQSAEMYPNDFDGIISGSAAADYNHLQDWSAHFRQITGSTDNDTFLTEDDWITVQSYILAQCDEPIDGVNDGILEDPTLCHFDYSSIPICTDSNTTSCLTATQLQTVEDAFLVLNNTDKQLIYPALLYGAQVDAFRLGLLDGSIQGIAQDWFRGGVFNDSSFDILTLTQADYNVADQENMLHGNVAAFNAELGSFQAAGGKMMMYHGMADPMTSGTNTQRYYLKLAHNMGLSNTEIDPFMRFFRISGMAHCGVGGISGAGAWEFGQSLAASQATNNIVDNLVAWVEKDEAPETLLGTKFWYDTPSAGIEFERAHCRFPYRTTYKGGDSTLPASWGCDFIENWQDCEGELCSEDGTFT